MVLEKTTITGNAGASSSMFIQEVGQGKYKYFSDFSIIKDIGSDGAVDDAVVKKFMESFVNLPLESLPATEGFQKTKRVADEILGDFVKRQKL